jgi:protein-S-isoprenylcysteine O-methyltransferase Ste14
MAKDRPLIVLGLTVCAYWGTVGLLVLYKRLRHGQSAGVVPQQAFERRLWTAMLPIVVLWIALPLLAVRTRFPVLAVPRWAQGNAVVLGARWGATGTAVGCYLLSLYCWFLMGRSWSMAIVPGQTTRLVTRGLYRWVRHPIYGASVLLMSASVLVLPTLPMGLLALAHLVVMNLKARHEERYLAERFGESYAAYCRKVGRFLPRWSFQRRQAA